MKGNGKTKKKQSLRLEVVAAILLIAVLSVALSGYVTVQMQKLKAYSESIDSLYLPGMQAMTKLELAISELDTQTMADAVKELKTINQTIGREDFTAMFTEVVTAYGTFNSVRAEAAVVESAESEQKLKEATLDLTNKIRALSTAYNEATSALVQQNNGAASLTLGINVATGGIMLLVSICVLIFLLRSIVTPTVQATKHLNEIITNIQNNSGDLTARIETKKTDEIGQLIQGINHFIEQLQGVMKDIKNHSYELEESSSNIKGQTERVYDRVTDIFATMEELSATMEEVSSTVTEMDAGAENIMLAMGQITEEANNGSDFAEEMKNRAIGIQNHASESFDSAQNMVQEIQQALGRAIEDSRSVSEIEKLTGDILSISSQTNLLALNASIEAARAGEAGRGFAVVADQIRVLSEESKEAANNIQEISQLVIEAVKQLTSSAEQMLDFTGNTVMNDYQVFLDATKQYQQDAVEMEQEMDYFRDRADGLKSTLTEMTNGINGITVSMTESSQGVNEVANAVSIVNDGMIDIEKESEKNDSISKELTKTVDMFKKM